ncbi:hypothetical protein BOX15_Mlig014212g1 [Macrostomum lignano]|uniref:Anoctamin n=1 Tax=Macrostomum lignano TaxID=282301 RepID=A0A267G3H9_9PLAT|nr:hypothetical protein BOX15_Mlig014212g1 [Macrostomum lignano]
MRKGTNADRNASPGKVGSAKQPSKNASPKQQAPIGQQQQFSQFSKTPQQPRKYPATQKSPQAVSPYQPAKLSWQQSKLSPTRQSAPPATFSKQPATFPSTRQPPLATATSTQSSPQPQVTSAQLPEKFPSTPQSPQTTSPQQPSQFTPTKKSSQTGSPQQQAIFSPTQQSPQAGSPQQQAIFSPTRQSPQAGSPQQQAIFSPTRQSPQAVSPQQQAIFSPTRQSPQAVSPQQQAIFSPTRQSPQAGSPQQQAIFSPTRQSPQAVSPQQQASFSPTRQSPQAKLVPQPTNSARTQQPTNSVPTKQPTNAASNPKPVSEATNDSEPPPRESIKTCFFRDGIRRVDYVLVWEEDLRDTEDYFSKKAAMHRKKFEDNLIEVGVEIERETCISSKKKIHFVKLFVSWTTMCYYAEYLGFRAPLEEVENRDGSERSSSFFSRSRSSELFSSPLEAKNMSKQKQFYTCAFSADKATKYIGISNKDTYFRPTQRFEVAFELLGTQIYGKKDQSEVGLDSMIRRGIYSCAYPPHEGSSSTPAGLRPEQMNARQLLHNYWARWKLWYKFQPLDHIRDYFGEKIAFYFAFIGYYTMWLVPATLVGMVTFLYGIGTINKSTVAHEICGSKKYFKMCPLCENIQACNYWYLSDICTYIRASYVFDNVATHFYAIFVSVWAYGFLKFWKRKTARLAYQWDVLDYVEMEERPRPEYASRCTEYEEDPITGNMEPHFPSSKRRLRILIGVLSLMVMMILSTASLIAMLMTRSSILHALFNNELVRSRAVTLANASSACVNLIIVLALELIYEKIAFNITEWEMHRTQTQFENQVIFKVFVFEIFNHYLSISYIAFIKGNVVGEPGKYNELFGSRLADCINGSCMFELTQLMAIILIGKQVAVQIIEMLIPKLLTFLHIGSTGLQANQLPNASQSWDADYMLIPYDTGLFMDYLELIMQFGFVTLFVPAFPLAPLFALINNLVEIRLDARKLVIGTRRPLPERAQSIGIWFSMMKFVAHLAVISNGSLMAFTSESLAISVFRPVYGGDLGFKNYTLSWAQANATSEPCRFNRIPNNTEYHWKLQAVRIVYMLLFQQLVTILTSVMNWFIPNIPQDLKRKIKRQKYLAKKALMDREMIGRRHKRAAFVA